MTFQNRRNRQYARQLSTESDPSASYQVIVDLHRILSQKSPFPASKTDPSATSRAFEMLDIRFARGRSFPRCKVGSIQRANQQHACRQSGKRVHFPLQSVDNADKAILVKAGRVSDGVK